MSGAGWALLLALAGLIAGSFIATLVVRWPAGRSVVGGRSACDGCGRTLTPVELVPLLSWAIQRGRCHGCGAAIDPRHPLIELACALVGAAAGLAVAGPAAIAGALFGWLLVGLAALDIAAFWLPDVLTGALAAAGVAAGGLGVAPTLGERLIGGAAGFGVLWLIGALYRRLRGREGLGGGDPKLLGAIGLWLGWQALPFVLLLACAIGLTAVALAMARGRGARGDDRLPFGALLAVAAYPAWLVVVGAGA